MTFPKQEIFREECILITASSVYLKKRKLIKYKNIKLINYGIKHKGN